MKDNMFKQSLRLFAKVNLWLLRILVSPFAAFAAVFFLILTLLFMLHSWANNNEEKFKHEVKELNKFWDGVIKWCSI